MQTIFHDKILRTTSFSKQGRLDFQGSYIDLAKTTHCFPEWQPTLQTNSDMGNESLSKHKKSVDPSKQDLTFVNSTGIEIEFAKNKASTKNGKTFDSLCWRYFRAGGSTSMLLCLVFSFILAQASTSGYDYWLAHW